MGFPKGNKYRFKDGSSPRFYRNLAFNYYPNFCYLCSSVRILNIHHLDGNRRNNGIENLRIICRSCHQKLHKIGFWKKPTITVTCIDCGITVKIPKGRIGIAKRCKKCSRNYYGRKLHR